MSAPDVFLMMKYEWDEQYQDFLVDTGTQVIAATRVFSTYEPLHTQYDCLLLNGTEVRMYNAWNCFWIPFDHMGQVMDIPEVIVND